MTTPHEAAAAAARDGYGRLIALLAAADGDLPAAEDALGDALERALRTWPSDGVPDRPEAWLLTVARNRQRDRWKSAEVSRTAPLVPERHAPVHLDDIDPDQIPDRRLELMLVCAHPAIDASIHTPLMLGSVLGFTAEQIGRALAVPKARMATRLVRAKKRIKTIGIPFRIPDRAQLPERLSAVLEAVYGAYAIEGVDETTRPEVTNEAIQLAEVLAKLLPRDPEVRGLAALLLLAAARAPARIGADGRFVALADQDPSRWDPNLIDRAHAHLRAAHAERSLGRFQLEAAIQAVHCARRADEDVDWRRLRPLLEGLARIAPSLGNGVALAVVLGESDGPAAGLAALDARAAALERFQPAWAARAHLLARLGRHDDAVAAYDGAIELASDPAAREFLARRRDAIQGRRRD